jgi:hypothetical protein
MGLVSVTPNRFLCALKLLILSGDSSLLINLYLTDIVFGLLLDMQLNVCDLPTVDRLKLCG